MNIIRVIDFETSDMEPPAGRVIEVGICDLTEDGEWRIGDADSWLCGQGVEMIAPGARAAHHISLADLAGTPPFDGIALNAAAIDAGVIVIAAHNAAYECEFLSPSLPVLCTWKAALRIWPAAPSHSNGALRYWLEDQGLIAPDHIKTMPAHRAGPDAYVTAHILKALLKHATGREMVAWTKEPALLPHCPIGKFKGKPWADVEAGFLGWMLRQPDMEADLKWNADRELKRRGQ